MTGPLGNSFVFPRILMFPKTSSQETARFSKKTKTVSLRTSHDPSAITLVFLVCFVFLFISNDYFTRAYWIWDIIKQTRYMTQRAHVETSALIAHSNTIANIYISDK